MAYSFLNVLIYGSMLMTGLTIASDVAANSSHLNELQLTASTQQIHAGFTSHLNINCSLPASSSPDQDTLLSLIISKETVSPQPEDDDVSSTSHVFTEVAAISSKSPHNITVSNPIGATVSGQLTADGLSFLMLDWVYPPEDAKGLYRCQAYSMDDIGHPHVSSAVTEISDKSLDLDTVLEKVKNLDLSLQNQLDQQREEIDALTSRLQDAWGATFEKSGNFQGHEYFLSRTSVWDIAAHQTACRAFGGYLVEINDKQEHDFIKTFVKSMLYQYVLVGMTDEEKEGRWMFLQSKQPVVYFDWVPGQPNNAAGTDDCVYLESRHDWKMIDTSCDLPTLMSRFVCEKS